MIKHISSLIFALCVLVPGARAISVNNTSGQLSSNITSPESETTLYISGTLNAADFFFIADKMPALQILDLSQAAIEAYSGTSLRGRTTYPAGMVPEHVFAGSKLNTVVFPASGDITIAENAFAGAALQGELVIPSNVKSICDGAFAGLPELTAVTINSTDVGVGSFNGSQKLARVTFVSPLNVGQSSFAACPELATVVGAENVIRIDPRAFADCPKLTAFTFGARLQSIGDEAFTASGLTSVDLSGATALTSVGNWAFARMPELSELNLGDVASLGRGVAFDCPKLTNITASQTNELIPDYAYTNSAEIDTTYLFNGSETSMGRYALKGHSNITSLTLPSTLTYIGDNAMEGLTSLQDLHMPSAEVPELGENVWKDVDQQHATLYVPAGSASDYEATPQWQEFVIAKTTGETPALEERLESLRGRFVGDELQVSISGTVITRLSVFDTAGITLAVVEPESDLVIIDTEGMSARIYLVSATLADGRTATLKLAK